MKQIIDIWSKSGNERERKQKTVLKIAGMEQGF